MERLGLLDLRHGHTSETVTPKQSRRNCLGMLTHEQNCYAETVSAQQFRLPATRSRTCLSFHLLRSCVIYPETVSARQFRRNCLRLLPHDQNIAVSPRQIELQAETVSLKFVTLRQSQEHATRPKLLHRDVSRRNCLGRAATRAKQVKVTQQSQGDATRAKLFRRDSFGETVSGLLPHDQHSFAAIVTAKLSQDR